MLISVAAVPIGRPLHAILDNYAVHKHPKVMAWIGRHPRPAFDLTPISLSWLKVARAHCACAFAPTGVG